MQARAPASGLTWLLALSAGCGSSAAPDPTIVVLAGWGAEYAAVRCAEIYRCCDSGEAARFGYADEGQCRQAFGAEQQAATDQIVATGLIAYDAKAARRCLDETILIACSQLFSYQVFTLAGQSCDSVFKGIGKLGSACEDLDFVCESANCEPSTGTCGPPRGCAVACAAGQYCDATNACAPVKAEGATCAGNIECTSPLVCRASACGAALPDGAACTSNTDCTGGVCVHDGAAGAACGVPNPDGVSCVYNTDCVSGACVQVPTDLRLCGPPVCDGS